MKNRRRTFCRASSHCSKTVVICAVAIAWNHNKKYCELDHPSHAEIGCVRRIELLSFLSKGRRRSGFLKQGRKLI